MTSHSLLRTAGFATSMILMSCVPCHATKQLQLGPTVAEQYLLAAANLDRAQRGLPVLTLNPELAEAARTHAREMANHGDISHQFDGEPDLTERGATAGVHFSLITENVAEASDPVMMHDLWMNSEGHRENLLDPEVNSVGISIIFHDHQYYAVEDFADTVVTRSFDDQESAVENLITDSGLQIADEKSVTAEEARKTCSMDTGFAGHTHPWYIMRYTADKLTELPPELQTRLKSGEYHKAMVGACSSTESGPFTSYNIAVLLYP
jgi:Cysteine-rich secretory protein family